MGQRHGRNVIHHERHARIHGHIPHPEQRKQTVFEAHWKKLDKEMATTFKFVYSALCDKLDANKETVKEMFPQAGKLEELTNRLKKGMDIIDKELKRIPNIPPTAPLSKPVRGAGHFPPVILPFVLSQNGISTIVQPTSF